MSEKFEPISVQEMYAQDRPSDYITWNVCRYLRRNRVMGMGMGPGDTCECCPSSHHDDDAGEEVIDGCRLVSEELARYVIAALRKEGWTPP